MGCCRRRQLRSPKRPRKSPIFLFEKPKCFHRNIWPSWVSSRPCVPVLRCRDKRSTLSNSDTCLTNLMNQSKKTKQVDKIIFAPIVILWQKTFSNNECIVWALFKTSVTRTQSIGELIGVLKRQWPFDIWIKPVMSASVMTSIASCLSLMALAHPHKFNPELLVWIQNDRAVWRHSVSQPPSRVGP